MKALLTSALLALSLGLSQTAVADDDYDYEDRIEQQQRKAAKISVAKAKQIAAKAVGGRVIDIDFDNDGRPHYDVEVLRGKTKYDVKVDANSGKVLSKRIDR